MSETERLTDKSFERESSRLSRFLNFVINCFHPVDRIHSGHCLLHEVWIQVDQLGVFALRVEDAYKVHRLVVLTACNSNSLVKVKNAFKTAQVFGLDGVETKTHRD
jgi:hypothetical protein